MYRDYRKASNTTLEAAADILKHSKDTLTLYEYQEKEPHPVTVCGYMDLCKGDLNLAQWHCANMCSVGKRLGRQFFNGEALHAGINVLDNINRMKSIQTDLLGVLADGVISPDEYAVIDGILDRGKTLNAAIAKLSAEKEKSRLLAHKRPFKKHEAMV